MPGADETTGGPAVEVRRVRVVMHSIKDTNRCLGEGPRAMRRSVGPVPMPVVQGGPTAPPVGVPPVAQRAMKAG